MGCVILLKLANRNIDFVLCENNETDIKFKEFYDNNKLLSYERIFITDLHLNKDNLELINNNLKLKEKTIIIDHNESALKYNSYEFVNIVIEEKGIKVCATSLLYNYLLNNNMLKSSVAINTFCEAVRKYDTGQWRCDKDNELPRDLSLLFEYFGKNQFIHNMYYKLKCSKKFYLSRKERYIISVKKNTVKEKIELYLKNFIIKDMFGYKAGIAFISYEYRNEIAQFLRANTNLYHIDFVILIATNHNSVSLRNVNPNVNVRPIAERFGGNGHFGAAGINLSNSECMDELLKIILSDDNKK